MKKVKIKIEVSSRHLHVCRGDLDKLFGKNYELKSRNKLSQKGQFAAKETLIIKNEKNEIKNVRIIGPTRKKTQVEISRTDAYKLKIDPPVRDSGNLKDSTGITLIGPKGKVKIRQGVIIARRHIHISPSDANKFNLKNKQIVSVKISGERGLIFEKVKIRINDDFVFRMHIDTDEANSAGISRNGVGEILV